MTHIHSPIILLGSRAIGRTIRIDSPLNDAEAGVR